MLTLEGKSCSLFRAFTTYQRAALLVARWSGARRDEIARLPLSCLDHYPDGTPRLHIPAGKMKRERIVPLNEEAARAIQDVQAIRQRERDRGFQDTQTGVLTRYLFVRRGKRLSYDYLFAHALEEACQAAGLMTPDSHPTITPIVFGTPWEPNWPNEEHGHEPLWPSLDIRRQACP